MIHTQQQKPHGFLLASAMTALTLATSSAAVTLGQTDDFQDGTTQGWINTQYMTNPPLNASNSGPSGAGDNALFGVVGSPQDIFSIANSTQWTGDYTAAGITSITLDINNLGPNTLSIGIMLNGTSGTGAVSVPSGSGWMAVSIDLTTFVFGSPSSLNNVTSLELINLPSGQIASAGAMDVYIDNITAVPEPGVVTLLALATLPWLKRRRATCGS